MDAWPAGVRVGGKVGATIYADGDANPIALLGRAVQRVRAWLSYVH